MCEFLFVSFFEMAKLLPKTFAMKWFFMFPRCFYEDDKLKGTEIETNGHRARNELPVI